MLAARGDADLPVARWFADDLIAQPIDADALRKAVADSVPPAMQKLNLAAFDKGFEYGRNLIAYRAGENGEPVALEAV